MNTKSPTPTELTRQDMMVMMYCIKSHIISFFSAANV